MKRSSSGQQVAAVLIAFCLVVAGCESTTSGGMGTRVGAIQIAPDPGSLEVDATLQLEAIPRDASGNPLQDREIFWASEDSAIARVSTSGLVTGKLPGSVRIAASSEGVAGLVTLTIRPKPVASLYVSPPNVQIVVGETVPLAATARDAADQILEGRNVRWISENPAVARADSNGHVTGVSVGTTRITATSEGKSASASVSVSPVPVAAVEVSPSTVEMIVGGTRRFTAVARAADGSHVGGHSVSWISSDPAVLSVSSDGVAKALAPGAAIVTALVDGKRGNARVSVTRPRADVAAVTVKPASARLNIGGTVQLLAVPTAADGSTLSGRTVTWASSNPAVARVDANGRVTGAAAGEAVVTATSEGKQGTSTISVVARPATGPVTLRLISGSKQQGKNNRPLPAPLVVLVLDGWSRPLTGVTVQWSTNNGSVSPTTTKTDALGRASTTWTLGSGGDRAPRSAWAQVDGLPRVEFIASKTSKE